MDLKQLSIGGRIYGTIDGKKGFSAAGEIIKAMQGADKEVVNGFLEVLGVGHTVIVDHNGNYEAESPDEAALVDAVSKLGYALHDRQGHNMKVQVGFDENRKMATYTILAINGFTSARARMSALVRKENGDHLLLAKGADSKMLELAASGDYSKLLKDLQAFSCEGLRTLVLGRRKFSSSEASSLVQEYENAHLAADKEQALAAVAEKMERNLEILGATAIEDKLQEGVGETIEKIRRAGIKLWVLTGDKLETARNIGFSCKVLTTSMSVLILEKLEEDTLQNMIQQAESNELRNVTTAMMCTGAALKHVCEEEESVELFLELAQYCSVVIACRVAPLQKAEMVNMVANGVTTEQGGIPITLAVGDGANDVPMIQAAKVGVGIYGKEGRQAVNNADFAIGQFRFLQRLLFVHGRWNYIRAAKVILFTFWRNAVLVLMMFYYTLSTGYSAVPLFEDMVRGTFNVVTFLPTLATGIMDRDFEAKVVLRTPELYETGREGKTFNVRIIIEKMLAAFIHSLLILLVMRVAYPGLDMSNIGDIYTYGTIVFTGMMTAVNFRLIHITEAWNWVFWLGIIVGCGIFYIFCIFVNSYMGKFSSSLNFAQMYMVAPQMVSQPLFWIVVFNVPALGMTLDFFQRFIWMTCPGLRDVHLDHALQNAQEAEELQEEKKKVEAEEREARRQGIPIERDISVGSSHDFNHPGAPRHPSTLGRAHSSTLQHCTGRSDSSDLANASWNSSGSYSRVSETSDEQDSLEPPKISQSKFIQQEIPICWNCTSRNAPTCTPCFAACTFSLVMGLMLVISGIIILGYSNSVAQARIHYDGTAPRCMFSDELGIKPAEVTEVSCPARPGESSSCTFNITLTENMRPPIYVFYDLYPFYQNYADYYQSVYWPELRGQEFIKDGRDKRPNQKCVASLRENQQGEIISPCGMQAKAMFNDTFSIIGVPLDETGIAWPSDVQQFKNPPEYDSQQSWDWLYKRFPEIINKTAGVKNEHFATWVRPDAYPAVTKTYARIHQPLMAGQNISVVINANYPVSQLASGVRKELILTTLSPLGGRNFTYAWFLIFSGVICMMVSVLVCAIQGLVNTFCDSDDSDESTYSGQSNCDETEREEFE
jgi:phosphoserine phosphatase